MRKNRGLIALLAAAALAVTPGVAFGQDGQSAPPIAPRVVEDVDDGVVPTVAEDTEEPGGGASDPVSTNAAGDGGQKLPFTGIDLAFVFAAAALLLALGAGMRRLTRSPNSA